MAMDGNQMGSEVAAAVLAQTYGVRLTSAEQALIEQYWQVICTAIVNHIVANGHALPGTFLDGESRPITGLGDLE